MDLREGVTPHSTTIPRGLRLLGYTILGVALLGAAGCAAPRAASSRDFHGTRLVAPESDEPLREQVRQELGTEAAEDLPPVPRPLPEPADPGAARFVALMSAAVDPGQRDEAGETRIGLWRIRNLSHARPREFDGFRSRCAELLTRAGRDQRLIFLADEAPVHYHLHGSAYLITAEGIDQWELHLALSPAGESWTAWEPPGPVRVLRQARPAGRQMFLPAPAGR